jgi:nifR3 family TIM-barrel protein
LTATDVFQKLGISKNPVLLAPLAGVSDHPFRRVCQRNGADITYVEMISATALLYGSERTLSMLKRHDDETRLGVQVTGRSAEDVGKAVAMLDKMPFDTIDINMGCPVRKVVKTGCGSAILKDPERVWKTVRLAREATDKPLSAKIRIGWDHKSINGVEVSEAIADAGADWLVVHGRTRADDYGIPVNLHAMAQIKKAVSIPVIGNGNIFSKADVDHMQAVSSVDGVMVSRGALGNPWLFLEINTGQRQVKVEQWLATIQDHLSWQLAEYGNTGAGAVCMRKHLLWYAKGWPGVKELRDKINLAESLEAARDLIEVFADQLHQQGCSDRLPVYQLDQENRFSWDPKWEMDRKLDRGVGDDGLEGLVQS